MVHETLKPFGSVNWGPVGCSQLHFGNTRKQEFPLTCFNLRDDRGPAEKQIRTIAEVEKMSPEERQRWAGGAEVKSIFAASAGIPIIHHVTSRKLFKLANDLLP